MRIFALLLLVVSLAAYRSQKTDSPQTATATLCSMETGTGLLSKSADGGKTWQDVSTGLPEKLTINRVLTQNGEVFLGTENGLYRSSRPETGIWEQENFGAIMTSNLGEMVLNEKVNTIFPGRSEPYVSVWGVGIYRKISGTNRWQCIDKTLEEKKIEYILETSDGTIFAGCVSGIYKSTDDGKSWKHVFADGWASNFVAAGNTLLANGNQGLLRSTDGGEHWENVLADKGGIYNLSVIDGRLTALRLAGPASTIDKAIRLLNSADGGQTWQRMDQGLSEIKGIYELKQAGNYLFCSHQAGISRSADGGKTWELVRSTPESKDPLRLEMGVLGKTIFAALAWGGC